MLVKYILLAGDDESYFNSADVEIKTERIKLATEIVYVALGFDFLPEVQFEKQNGDDWWGLCCNGGKLIKFKYDCIKLYANIFHTLCHEVRHTLQHYIVNNYRESFKQAYGISRNLANQMKLNFDNYINIADSPDPGRVAYKYQLVEADANSFADDCADGAEEAYTYVNLS